MATEIAIFQLQAGKHPEDSNSAVGQVLKDTLDTLTEQAGFQRAYWGTESENPSTFRLFVDWDSVDAHIKFTKTDQYKPFLERFGQMAELDSAQMYHTSLTPHPATEALSDHVSPVTEIDVAYFSKDFSQKDQFLECYKQQVANIEDQANDIYTASAGGWVEEEISIPSTSEKGIAWVGLIGWRSMEAHMQWQSRPAYAKNEELMNQMKDQIKHISTTHASLTQVNKGAGGVADMGGAASKSIQDEILNPQEAGKSAPKTAADGSTTKNNDDLKGAANSTKKERSGR